jgi:two-component system, NarL family, response regulator NreC
MTKILIVDDNVEFRQRVKVLLGAAPELTLLGEADDGYEAISKTIELKPDVVIMDIKMGDMNGLRATHQLKEKLPEVQVIILSRFDYQEYREAAIARGASAYVVKKNMIEDLLPAIRQVIDDQGKRTEKVTS